MLVVSVVLMIMCSLWIWSQFKKMIETNDLVTELERIKAK
jgi:hypothetical protein